MVPIYQNWLWSWFSSGRQVLLGDPSKQRFEIRGIHVAHSRHDGPQLRFRSDKASSPARPLPTVRVGHVARSPTACARRCLMSGAPSTKRGRHWLGTGRVTARAPAQAGPWESGLVVLAVYSGNSLAPRDGSNSRAWSSDSCRKCRLGYVS